MRETRNHRQPLRIRAKSRTVLLLGLVIALPVVAGVGWWSTQERNSAVDLAELPPHTPILLDDAQRKRVTAFCGDCHGLPNAVNYSQSAWRAEVLRGYEFYARSGRTDLDPPEVQTAIAYFQSLAPVELNFPVPEESKDKFAVQFRVEQFAAGKNVHFPPAVSHLRWTQLNTTTDPVLVACDMRQGVVASIDLAGGSKTPNLIGRLHHPCHAEPCDLDGDGKIDLVVADMGGLAAVDFELGRVVWLRQGEVRGQYEELIIAEGLGRVSDVRPADVDGDGKLDLLVGEFGARKGGIQLFLNRTEEGGEIRFDQKQIDQRPGTVHLLVHDLNDDDRLDFIALVSQEFEAVDAFINHGNGEFRRRPLWEAADPAFGSSGAQLVDLDQDGDTDVLFSNGDSFDDKYIKPCHGVQWLENRGDLDFAYHRLTDLPGTYRAVAGDIDRDGDADIIAAVWVEPRVQFGNPAMKEWVSIICLEQTSPGKFARHTLETGSPWYATAEMADFDADGDLDLAFGSHSRGPSLQLPNWLTVWWNLGAAP